MTHTSATMVKQMRNAAHNILYSTGNHGSYVHGSTDIGTPAWIKTFVVVDILLFVLLAAIMVCVILRWRKNKAKVAK